jgi:hypothetical protein
MTNVVVDPITAVISIGRLLIGGDGGWSGLIRRAAQMQADAQAEAANIAAAQPLPLPAPVIVPPPGATPPIFPTGRAANDAIFKTVGKSALPKILGPGSLVVTAVEILIEILQRRQDKLAEEIIESQDDDRAARARRAAREGELREVTIRGLGTDPDSPLPDFSGRPQTVSLPQRIPTIFEPGRIVLPDIGIPLPRIGAPGGLPRQIPNPVSPPEPAIPRVPSPVAVPTPRTTPQSDPFPFPLPFLFPFSVPQPVGSPRRLTPSNPLSVPSPGAPVGMATFLEPRNMPLQQTNPDRCRPRRCDDDLEEERTNCYKGLYREGPFDTDFTQWIEIDCLTGKEI